MGNKSESTVHDECFKNELIEITLLYCDVCLGKCCQFDGKINLHYWIASVNLKGDCFYLLKINNSVTHSQLLVKLCGNGRILYVTQRSSPKPNPSMSSLAVFPAQFLSTWRYQSDDPFVVNRDLAVRMTSVVVGKFL